MTFNTGDDGPRPTWDEDKGLRVSGDAQGTTNQNWNRSPSLLNALWRYRWAVLAVALISAMAGYIYASVAPPKYEATGRIVLASPHDRTLFRDERGVNVEVPRYVNTEAYKLTSPDVLARAAEQLGDQYTVEELREDIVEAESSPVDFTLTVKAKLDDPEQAANVVNAVMQGYEDAAAAQARAQVEASVAELRALQDETRERLADLPSEPDSDSSELAQRDSLNEELIRLQGREGQVRADAAVFGVGVERVERAVPPDEPASQSPRRMAAIFGLLGFIAALIVAFWRGERTEVIDHPDDVARGLDAPLLGVVSGRVTPTAKAAAPVVTAPATQQAREHQLIASKLALMSREPRVLVVTSPQDAPGKSVTSLNLALSAALDQRVVILVDADPAGWLTTVLGADGKCGFSELVSRSANGDIRITDCISPVERLPMVHGFRFIPAGTADRDRSTGLAHMAKLMARLLQEADFIVLDTAPLLRAPGATKLAAEADAVVLVVGRGTTVDDVRSTTNLLRLTKASFIGYVFDRSRGERRVLRDLGIDAP